MIKKMLFYLLFILSLFCVNSISAVEVIYYPTDCVWGADCNTLYSCDGSMTYVGTGNNNDNYSSLHYNNIDIPTSDIISWQFCVQGIGNLNTGSNSNSRCFETNGLSYLHEYCCITGLFQDTQSFQNMKDYMTTQYWYHQNAGVTKNDTLDCAYYKINYTSVLPTAAPTSTPSPTPTQTTKAPTPIPTNILKSKKINICHYQVNTKKWKVIQISSHAWLSHQNHGKTKNKDYLYNGPIILKFFKNLHIGEKWCQDHKK